MADKELEILKANVSQVMALRAGQDVMWEILGMCGLYTDNSISADQGIEGKRAVGLQILQLLEDVDPKIYPNLLITKQEQENARTNNSN